jgi:hypothetical protein
LDSKAQILLVEHLKDRWGLGQAPIAGGVALAENFPKQGPETGEPYLWPRHSESWPKLPDLCRNGIAHHRDTLASHKRAAQGSTRLWKRNQKTNGETNDKKRAK